MKRALIISNSSGLVTDFLDNDMNILKERGYKIDCACNLKYPGKDTDNFIKKHDINVLQVDFPIRNLDIKMIVKSFFELKKILKENEYDIVHCHSTIAAAIGRECAKKYRRKGTKVLYTSHGFPFYEGNYGKKAKMFFQIEKYYSKYTDAILTICNEDYNNALNMKCKNVYLMHGVGINVDNFINTSINRDEYRKKLGFSEKDKVILSVGELNTNKNHQVVIRAISELDDPNIVYAICGREVTETGKMKELNDLAESLDVRVKFLGFRKDIPEICHSADIGALPSLKEGLGLSGIEMLASGIPVVGSNRQGIKDYIKNGVTGYLAEPDSVESFAKAISDTFKLKLNNKTKDNCISMTKNFNISQAYKTVLKAYDTIL